MNYRIDNLQYCNWSREIFEINKEAGLNAVHVTIVYHEDYEEFLKFRIVQYFGKTGTPGTIQKYGS